MSVFGIFCSRNKQSRKHARLFVYAFLLTAISAILVASFFSVKAEPSPTTSITITSTHTNYENNEPGSWAITKSAKWLKSGTAQIQFEVNSLLKHDNDIYYDVVFLIDNSGSMLGDKLDRVKQDATDLIDTLLSNSNNRIALATFGSSATILSNLSNDKNSLVQMVNEIVADGCTNYNQALAKVLDILDGYTQQQNRELVLLFLTDGLPNVETYNEYAQYQILKETYPFMTINGIQYEMGIDILDPIINVTDYQFIADMYSLENVLYRATIMPYIYEDFVITDYINNAYWSVEDIDSIYATLGTVSLEYEGSTPKVIWDMSGKYRSGQTESLTITIKIKENLGDIGDSQLPTNIHETIESTLKNTPSEDIDSDLTPSLKYNYKVTYDANSPSSCTVAGSVPEASNHAVFSTVEILDNKLSCDGYIFNGWKVSTPDIRIINDDYFSMPGEDVVIMAIWKKPSISKTMEGTVHQKITLYQEIAQQTTGTDENIDFNKAPSSSNGLGVVTVASTASDTYPVHYFRGGYLDNNVVFAGQCWLAIRTTSTGGVKLFYNGPVSSSGRCDNSRQSGKYIYYGSRSSRSLYGNYWYGSSYVFNSDTGTYSLSGTMEQATWSTATSSNLIGKYTCQNTADPAATCSTLYYIQAYNSNTSAFVIPLGYSNYFYAIGRGPYNNSYQSISHVGYMYGSNPPSSGSFVVESNNNYASTETVLSSTSMSANYYYAEDVVWLAPTQSRYQLVNPVLGSTAEDYPSSLVGNYTLRSSSATATASTAYYIAGTNGTNIYYIGLTSGKYLSELNPTYTFGDSLIENNDGTYTLNNPVSITKSQWYDEYANLVNLFTCGSDGGDTCENPRFVSATTATNYSYITGDITLGKTQDNYALQDTITVKKYELAQNPSDYDEYRYTCGTTASVCDYSTLRYIVNKTNTNYKYANNYFYGADIDWNGESYTLIDPIDLTHYNDMNALSTHHYVCAAYSTDRLSCTKVGYIYYASNYMYYVTLEDGATSVDSALARMNSNDTDSHIKAVIDSWYSNTLADYTHLIEDTPYCNDRSMPNSVHGWVNGGAINQKVRFGGNLRTISGRNPTIECPNANDMFTVSEENGNGALTYPIALMTNDEVAMAGQGNGNSSSQPGGYSYRSYVAVSSGAAWTMTPESYANSSNSFGAMVSLIVSLMGGPQVDKANDVRPVISVKPGITIEKGDGSENNPWVLANY